MHTINGVWHCVWLNAYGSAYIGKTIDSYDSTALCTKDWKITFTQEILLYTR